MKTPKKRGRPAGTRPNLIHDEPMLRAAARNLHYGLSKTASAVFSSLLDRIYDRAFEDDYRKFHSVLRRLQRHWERDGERYLEEAGRNAWSGRWQFEADQLQKASPELARTIRIFAASPPGEAVLLKYGRDGVPAEPMSLGLVKLWEEIVKHSAIGPLRADELFERAYAEWSLSGLEPDAAFLHRFAELCLAQADRLSAPGDTIAGGDALTSPADLSAVSERRTNEQ